MFEPTIKDLVNRCEDWGVELDPEKLQHTLDKTKGVEKYSRWDLTKLIVAKTLPEYYMGEVPKSAKYMNALESAMMSARFPELKSEQQELLLADNNEFYVEQKMNGHRCRIFYSPEEGWKFYANNRSTDSLLVADNTPQVLFIRNGIESTPSDYIGKFRSSFVLDSEVIIDTKNVDATAWGGELSNSELNGVGILMQIQPEISHEIQRTQKGCQLKFMVFDILQYNNFDLMNKPLCERNKIRDKLLQQLEAFNLPLYNLPRVYTDKKGYFEKLVSEGKEGVIFKNANEIYTPNKTRNKLRQIKWKRDLTMTLGEDIDAFIIGAEESTQGKAFEDYIGAIKFGVYLNTIEGEQKLHHIASVGNMPLELRKKMTVIDQKTGKPTLNEAHKFLVYTISGFDIKDKSLRFSHAKVLDWEHPRVDKTPDMCILEEEILRMQVL